MKMFADRVKESTTTTGTGDYTLGGAATGCQSFANGFAINDVLDYCCENGLDWEVGTGTLTAADTLSRDTILASSNAGAAVDWGLGAKTIFSTLSARQARNPVFAGASIESGVLTASTPALNISQEWNNAGVAFNALNVDVTPTAHSNGSALATLGYGGYPYFGWYKYGSMVTIGSGLNANGAPQHGFMSDAGLVVFGNNSNPHAGSTARAFIVRSPDTLFNQNGVIRFGDNWASYSSDIGIGRNAAGVLEVNNSTLGTLRDLIARNTITPGVTAASLAGAQQGARSFVTDSTVAAAGNFGAVVAGGGANAVPVYYDGTNWRIG